LYFVSLIDYDEPYSLDNSRPEVADECLGLLLCADQYSRTICRKPNVGRSPVGTAIETSYCDGATPADPAETSR
jgi:hypothetical protein